VESRSTDELGDLAAPGHQGTEQRAVRLHLKLRVADEAPIDSVLTTGDTCERAAFQELLVPGEIYLGDRNYGEDYALLERLGEKGCDFLIRARNNAVIRWESEEPLTAADREAGIIKAGLARLGARQPKGPWRVIILARAGEEPVCLIASACWAALRPAEVAGFYRQRWKIEHFFRWLKCLVPCRHWFAESPQGVSFQIYLSLIAALLLAQTLQRRPNLRMLEALQFFQMGWATEEETAALILKAEQEAQRKQELAARKKAQAAQKSR
jgi:Transposase DDE domain